MTQPQSIDPTAQQYEVHYPDSDGKPIGETDFHIAVIVYLRQVLRRFFRHSDDTYVAADMLLYYEAGNPAAFRVPDTFVVKGVSTQDRRVFKIWEEKAAPCVVFEITSRSTRLEDQGTKRALYEMLGVREYFLFDPLEEYLTPRLQGLRLVDGAYAPMVPTPDGDLLSEELGLRLMPEGKLLRLVDCATGERLPTLDEAIERAETEAERAEAEAGRAKAEAKRASTAETEVARLREELSRLRRSNGT